MENFNDIRDWLNADFCEGGGIEEDRIQELYDYARLLEKALDKVCEDDVDNYYHNRLREGKERPTQEEYDKMLNIVKKRYLEESEKQ